jgi:hypothetical protein
MKRIQLLLQIIKINPIQSKMTQKFPLLLKAINKTLSKIKNYETPKAANACFDELQEAHRTLSKLFYNYNIDMTPELDKFIYDCERLDDNETREYFFKEIKNDRYSLSS